MDRPLFTEEAPGAWPRGLTDSAVDELLVVFSDVEMGAGGPTDDFPQSRFLGELIRSYGEDIYRNLAVTVVFNGDTFDLLKTPHEGAYPTRIDASVALAKLSQVMRQHAAFFEQLRQFLVRGHARRKAVFILGNHDLELAFPEVQDAIRGACAGAIEFPGQAFRTGDVVIEHGFQADPLFTVEPSQPFVEHEGERLLNLPWGSVALLEVAVPFTDRFYAVNRMKPREEILERLPEVRDVLLDAFWRYWTRDYWRAYFADADPLKRVSWTMLKEIAYRFGSHDPEVSMGRHYQQKLRDNPDLRLCVVGHQHEAAWWSLAGRKVLRTGCMRNEYVFERDGRLRLLPKIYAEIFMRNHRAVRSHLIEIDAPSAEPGYMPDSFDAVSREAAQLLELHAAPARAAQDAQERKEAPHYAEHRRRGASHDFLRTLRRALSRDMAR